MTGTKRTKLTKNGHDFFANNNSFVNFQGYAYGSDDFYISLVIGSDGEQISLSLNEWGIKDRLKFFKAVQDRMAEALAFYEKLSAMPKAENYSIFSKGEILGFNNASVPGKKKAPAKKAAAKKTTP
jgi:hypothetical protein